MGSTQRRSERFGEENPTCRYRESNPGPSLHRLRYLGLQFIGLQVKKVSPRGVRVCVVLDVSGTTHTTQRHIIPYKT
jgi:hypothetical protein